MHETDFYSLPTGKLHKKSKQSRLKNFSASYVGSFYRNLEDSVDNFLGFDFFGELLTMLTSFQKTFKNSYLLPQISQKIYQMTLIIT